MAGGDTPFPLSEMMTQGFEQTRKAMESYLDFFEKNLKAAPWLDAGPCSTPAATILRGQGRSEKHNGQ
jgi:hypothetical protein